MSEHKAKAQVQLEMLKYTTNTEASLKKNVYQQRSI